MIEQPLDYSFKSSGPLDKAQPSEDKGQSADSTAVQERADALSVYSNAVYEEVILSSVLGDMGEVAKAKESVASGVSSGVTGRLEDQLTDGGSLEDIQASYEDSFGKVNSMVKASDFLIETGLTANNPAFTASMARYAINTSLANQVFTDRIKTISDDTGFGGMIFDFIDRYIIRQLPIGAFEDITRRSERSGADLLQAAVTMEPDDYRVYINAFADSIASEGFFTSENLFAMQRGYGEAINAGYDPDAALDQVFGALDLLTLGVGSANSLGKLKNLSKARSSVTKVAAVEGPDVAVDVADSLTKAGSPRGLINNDVTPSVYSFGDTPPVKPNTSRSARILERNNIIREVEAIQSKGAVGRVATESEVSSIVTDVVQTYGKRYTNSLADYKLLSTGLGNKVLRATFGTAKGSPYKGKASAERAAKEIDGAIVVPVNKDDLGLGYYLELDKRLDLSSQGQVHSLEPVFSSPDGSPKIKHIYDALRELTSKAIGSAALRGSERLTTAAQLGEAGSAAFKAVVKPYTDKIEKLKGSDREIIGRVMSDLNDGADSFKREWYTKEEFIAKYQNEHPTGMAPSQKVEEAWEALVDIDTASFILKANEVLQRFIAKDFVAIRWGEDLEGPARKVKELEVVPSDAKVWDAKNQVKLLRSELPDGTTNLWKLEKSLEDGSEYVLEPQRVRILEYDDVMGFNAGGGRSNPLANYYVVLGDLGDTALRPKAMLSTFSQKQAQRAVTQLDNLTHNFRKGTLTDELVRANNDWNPNVHSVDDLKALAKERGWDLARKVSHKARDGEVVTDKDSPLFGSTAEDFFSVDMRRMDDVLMEYGGGANYNISPLNAVVQQYGTAANALANRAHTVNAMNSWAKTAIRRSDLVKLDPQYRDNPYRLMQTAQIIGKSPEASRLWELRAINMRRMGMRDPAAQAMQRLGQGISEYVFDNSGFTGLRHLDKTENLLLKTGFQSAFGFGNVSQFFMQGFAAISVVAISPTQGIKGIGAVPALRFAMNAPDAATEALAFKRFAKFTGLSDSEVSELVTYVRTSGRAQIDGDAVELGTGVGYGVSSYAGEKFNKALEIGVAPFRAGERFGRLTAINTAFLEFKAKHPDMSAISDFGRNWITKREQTLTLNMTTSSRPAFQSGLMKVPTQWMSYSFRALEAVAFGTGGLKPAERARLFASLTLMFGATGFGAATAADWAAEKLGISPESDVNVLLKYGLIDYAIGQTTGLDTAVATRLAPIDLFIDTYRGIMLGEKSFLEVVGGPSGAITESVFGATFEALGHLAGGRPVSLGESVLKVLRQPSGLDNLAKAYGVFNNGLYKTKTGAVFPGELKPSDALIIALGFSPLEIVELQQRRTQTYNSGKKFREFSREMDKKAEVARTMLDSPSRDEKLRGVAMLREIEQQVGLSGFSPSQMMNMRRSVWSRNPSSWYTTARQLLQEDRTFEERRLKHVMEGN